MRSGSTWSACFKGVLRGVAIPVTLALLPLSMATYSHAVTITVDALAHSSNSGSGAGLDTGLSFLAGDILSISVSPTDLWSAGDLPRWSNADGLIGNLYATGSDESGQPAGTLIGQNWGTVTMNGFNAPYGALVGEISGSFFLIGTNYYGPAPNTGNLKLYYWDTFTSDNKEHISANLTVQVSTVPEPSTLLITLPMLGTGLLWAVRPRRRREE